MQDFVEQFPHFQLEDKLSLEGWRIVRAQDVRPKIKNVYARKRRGRGPKPNEGQLSEESMRRDTSGGNENCN